MIKKELLMFTGLFDTVDIMVDAIVSISEDYGYHCNIVVVGDRKQAAREILKLVQHVRIDAVLTFNHIFYDIENEDGRNLWEAAEIPFLNILLDHPFHFHKALSNAPSTSILLVADRNHRSYLQRFYPNLADIHFLPHAGVASQTMEPKLKDRQIEVLYAGNLSRFLVEGLIPDLGEITEFDAFALTREVLNRLISSPDKTTEAAIEEYLLEKSVVLCDHELSSMIEKLRFLDSYATSFYREQSVRVLVESGIRVTVFGDGWEECEWADHPCLILGGRIPAGQVPEIMKHSKIVLNTMTWFKDGVHDRIWNGMLAGAVVVTDDSMYLQELCNMNIGNIPFCEIFQLKKVYELPERIRLLLTKIESGDQEVQELAERGQRYAQEHHTWNIRTKEIFSLLERKNEVP